MFETGGPEKELFKRRICVPPASALGCFIALEFFVTCQDTEVAVIVFICSWNSCPWPCVATAKPCALFPPVRCITNTKTGGWFDFSDSVRVCKNVELVVLVECYVLKLNPSYFYFQSNNLFSSLHFHVWFYHVGSAVVLIGILTAFIVIGLPNLHCLWTPGVVPQNTVFCRTDTIFVRSVSMKYRVTWCRSVMSLDKVQSKFSLRNYSFQVDFF